MENARLGLGATINNELINNACSMAMEAHESPEKPYLLKKCRSLSNTVIVFSFPGFWSINDWFTGDAFGEKKIDLAQFPSLKRIATEEVATVNEAFLNRFQAILPNVRHEVGKFVREGKQIVFTGHSSGGPIAILVTVWFLEEQVKTPDTKEIQPPLCLTFGSPLVGDSIFNHALSRENWSQYFTHFVVRYDVVPRIFLSPLSSIEQELIFILNFLNPRSTLLKQEPLREASTLYVTVLRNISSLASCAACNLMGNTYNLVETLSVFIELSPYRPFGTYVFCTGNEELVVVENPDAVLQVLFYSFQMHSEQDVPAIPMRSLKDHQDYLFELQSLKEKNVTHLDNLEMLPLSADGGDVGSSTIHMALNNLGLSTRARLCLCAAKVSEKQKLRNQTRIDAKKVDIENGIRLLELYKHRCEARKVSYYDAFKISVDHDDFNANMKRLELAGIFDELMEMIKKYKLPDGFEGRREWIDIGTRYRRIVEPLEIANYHRHLKFFYFSSYMIGGRPTRYGFTQKWYEYARRMETQSIPESCFWAEVEELDVCLKYSKEELSDDVKERISRLEKNVEAWFSRKELGLDVFFDDSTFVKWWKTLSQKHGLGSSFSRFINQ